MKEKITISLDENILAKLDTDVESGKWKNRSQIIETILKEKYWEFVDVTAIIFAHDYKWDNRKYPFDEPKALLKIKWETIISKQVNMFASAWITNIIILIPKKTSELFKTELFTKFRYVNIDLIELDPDLKTWAALREALKEPYASRDLIISNGDIYYWNLNLDDYYKYCKEQKWDFSLLLKFVMNAETLWNIQINGNKIIWYVEKPKASNLFLTNSWLYVTTRDFLDKHDFWDYLEYDFFPKLPSICNNIWYIYSWQWEHVQNDSAYERANGWNI